MGVLGIPCTSTATRKWSPKVYSIHSSHEHSSEQCTPLWMVTWASAAAVQATKSMALEAPSQ